MPQSSPISDISVVIPVHNGGVAFKRCLKAMAQLHPQPREIIVVSNGDTDESWLAAKQSGFIVIRLPTAGGPAVARNIGARAAKGKYLLFIDADVEVKPMTIAQVSAIFQQEPTLAAIMGSYDDEPGDPNFLSQYRNLLHHHTHQASCSDVSSFWAGCGAIDRKIFLAMGGFNERYRKPCIEDIELGYRLKQAGYTSKLCKDIQVKHLKSWTMFSLLKTDIFYRALPWTSLILANRHINNELNLKLENRISACLIYGLILSVLAIVWSGIIGFWLTIIFALSLIFLNRSLYRLFYSRHGLRFSIKAICWHWFYYLYSSMAFASGYIWYEFKCSPFLQAIIKVTP
ncbi:glycosyltransferase [Leptolyngbya cf. ectocarpi LEGE 11479]|uniref:Glycosyltransferase n=1 Tax=Leptolyngbya cf. ectocarpi LEGE 11479 TaxID=1828722 RepID=A0A928X121_LEPEC|nr:glycosyltransferase [Leptolyngbya ectocarpi]MBE9066482.1 glycosyltransferase [Leptolyngbya cf. ectocarpi LEGE 11479]